MIHLGFWDIALLVLVSAQATLLAYLSDRKWKAVITALPIPFTLAALAVGLPVGTTNVLALVLLLGFMHAVRLLKDRGRVPIIPAIVVSAGAYCALGALLVPLTPRSGPSFWVACAAVLALGLGADSLFPRRDEPEYRSPMSPWLKFPLVAAVILALILIKHQLQGFMTLFPMVGVFAAYETRFSLGTLCRTFSSFILAMVPMQVVVRLLQPRLGLGPALLVGWVVFLPFIVRALKNL
jgi:hypothetical protein